MRHLVLMALLACREQPAPDAGHPLPIPPPGDSVRYDCGFVSIEPAECELGPEWIAELDRFGSAFIESTTGPPTEEVCRRTSAALDRALAADLTQLTVLEKLAAQNGALRAVGPRTCDPPISKKAVQVVLRFALPAAVLAELGSEPLEDMEEWLGPRSSWIDRRTKQTDLFHDTMEFFTQSFRPVRSGTKRAVLSQMIAADTEGRVYVTPLIGRIEMREDEALDAPACVGKLDARRLRCDRGRVRPLAEEDLPHNVFVHRTAPGIVDCNRCHAVPDASANLIDLAGADQLAARRAGFMLEAQAMMDSIRTKVD